MLQKPHACVIDFKLAASCQKLSLSAAVVPGVSFVGCDNGPIFGLI